MKYIYKAMLATLVALATICTSCEDFYDVSPGNGLKEEDYSKNRNDLNAGALGIYSALSKEVHKFLLWGSARADLVTVGAGIDPYITEFVNNNVTTLNPYTNYSGIYKAIARCNQQLENITKVAELDKTLTGDDIGAYYGEVYYLRALCYFYLVRTFHDVPLLLDNIADNVTYTNADGTEINLKTLMLTEDEIRAIALKPASEQKVWEQIWSDILKSMGMLRMHYKWDGQGLSDREKYGRANLPTCFALGCEVAMWMQSYLKASTYADLIIKNSGYDVSGTATWGNQFTTMFASGHAIGLLCYDYGVGLERNRLMEFTSNQSSHGGKYLLKPVKSIVDSLFVENGDIRYNNTYKRIAKDDLIWKYIGLDNKESMRKPYQSDASWQIFRSADTYLMKGMAENRLNNPGGAIYFLNIVRRNRGLEEYNKENLDMSLENLENLLLAERARELAFEGKRWYDLLLVSKVFGREDLLPMLVSKKYKKEDRAKMYQYLQNKENWLLPVDPQRWK